MSIYKMDDNGNVYKVGGSITQRWNDRIFRTEHSVVEGQDYYDIEASAVKYILSLTSYTEFQLYISEPNATKFVNIRFNGQSLRLECMTEEMVIGGLLGKTNCYTLDITTGKIWVDNLVELQLLKPEIASKLNKDFTSLIEEVSLSLSDVFVVDKGSGARKVNLGTIASYLSTQESPLFTIVEELPNENQNTNTIYLLVTENEDGGNQLLEYIWIANQERWELIGTVGVDLSDYYTKAETNGLLEGKVDKVAGKGLSTNDYTNTDKQSVEKIPTIEQDILDLESDKVDKNNAITGATKTKITYDSKGLVTAGDDLVADDIPELPQSKINGLVMHLLNKVTKNADIVGATKTKITYDSKGLVKDGADLTETDIPPLPASKITQDANNRFVTDTEKSTWNGKQNALTAGDGISISGNVIRATGLLTVEVWNTPSITLPLTSSNKLFYCSHTANQTLTIPTNATFAFPIGTMVTFLLTSTFKVTFNVASGVTLMSMDNLVELKTQYAMASLIKIATDTWQLVGALE